MTYPEAHEDFPWGEVAIKVKNKVFLFLHSNGETLSLSCKLPQSSDMALMLPFAKPTGYGLGKSGWVSASFNNKNADEEPPVELLREWIDESYRAVAPKTLVAEMRGGAAGERVAGAGGAKAGKVGGGAKVGKTGGAAKVGKTGGAAKVGKTGGAAKVGKTGGAAKVGRTGGAAAKAGSKVTKAAKTGSKVTKAAKSAKAGSGAKSAKATTAGARSKKTAAKAGAR
ncbi:MAG TPA: MmcQ/YjbR family DNA-binding protein [Nannocystis sp.]|jgi:predicted DNA-binding protein (MmcQ/YjbR family)